MRSLSLWMQMVNILLKKFQISAPIIRNEADVVIGSRFLRRKNIKNDKGSYLENQKEFSYLRKFGIFLFSQF